jgi:hypothetical protein
MSAETRSHFQRAIVPVDSIIIEPDDPHGGNGLTQGNPSDAEEAIRLGQEAMARKRLAWVDWMAIARALEVGRARVMHDVDTNVPTGRRYEKAMADWLIAHSFKEIDKGTRSRLLECLKHRVEIERWRSVLTGSERFRLNHPNAVLRKWRAATTVPDPNAEAKTSPFARLKESVQHLSEENHRLRREIERGGGGLTPKADSANGSTTTADVAPSNAELKRRQIFKKLLLLAWQHKRFVTARAAKTIGVSASEFRQLLKEHDLKRPWEAASQQEPKTKIISGEKHDVDTD